jgi:hypothetical protein
LDCFNHFKIINIHYEYNSGRSRMQSFRINGVQPFYISPFSC